MMDQYIDNKCRPPLGNVIQLSIQLSKKRHPEALEATKELRIIGGAKILRLPLVAQNDAVYDTFS